MITFRKIDAGDAEVIAAMHRASWRTAYRGIMCDEYLDGEIAEERLGEWRRRLSPPREDSLGWMALHDGAPAGFIFGFQHEHDCWGTIIDNLHVLPEWKGRGIGRELMARFATTLIERGDTVGVFLWVYEKNVAARSFYTAVGGKMVEETDYSVPGGGTARILRMTWSHPTELRSAASTDNKNK